MIGEQPVGPAESEVPYAKIAFRVGADTGRTVTRRMRCRHQVASTAVAVEQQFHNDDRVQALAQELLRLKGLLRGGGAAGAEAAKSALSVEEQRWKSAALAKDAAAAREELTTAMAKHRQALAEEREGRASLLATAAVKDRQSQGKTSNNAQVDERNCRGAARN